MKFESCSKYKYWFQENILEVDVCNVLSHLPLDKMAAISQMTFCEEFSWMKRFKFQIDFSSSLFLRVQLILSQHWFRLRLRAKLPEPMLTQFTNTYICSTRERFCLITWAKRVTPNGWWIPENNSILSGTNLPLNCCLDIRPTSWYCASLHQNSC